MAVPDTNTFSLSDVTSELGLTGSARNLSNCFAQANASLFDSRYSGAKDRLSNFRNYGGTIPLPSLTISPTSYSTGTGADSFTITITSNTSWSVTDNAAWISVGPNSGSGNGSTLVSIQAGGPRSATVTVKTTAGSPQITRSCIVEQGPA